METTLSYDCNLLSGVVQVADASLGSDTAEELQRQLAGVRRELQRGLRDMGSRIDEVDGCLREELSSQTQTLRNDVRQALDHANATAASLEEAHLLIKSLQSEADGVRAPLRALMRSVAVMNGVPADEVATGDQDAEGRSMDELRARLNAVTKRRATQRGSSAASTGGDQVDRNGAGAASRDRGDGDGNDGALRRRTVAFGQANGSSLGRSLHKDGGGRRYLDSDDLDAELNAAERRLFACLPDLDCIRRLAREVDQSSTARADSDALRSLRGQLQALQDELERLNNHRRTEGSAPPSTLPEETATPHSNVHEAQMAERMALFEENNERNRRILQRLRGDLAEIQATLAAKADRAELSELATVSDMESKANEDDLIALARTLHGFVDGMSKRQDAESTTKASRQQRMRETAAAANKPLLPGYKCLTCDRPLEDYADVPQRRVPVNAVGTYERDPGFNRTRFRRPVTPVVERPSSMSTNQYVDVRHDVSVSQRKRPASASGSRYRDPYGRERAAGGAYTALSPADDSGPRSGAANNAFTATFSSSSSSSSGSASSSTTRRLPNGTLLSTASSSRRRDRSPSKPLTAAGTAKTASSGTRRGSAGETGGGPSPKMMTTTPTTTPQSLHDDASNSKPVSLPPISSGLTTSGSATAE